MIEIASNFTSSINSLKSEQKLRSSDNEKISVKHENRLWLMLYELGFTKMNIEGDCIVKFGRNLSNYQQKKVDVIAESKEIRSLVEPPPLIIAITSGS